MSSIYGTLPNDSEFGYEHDYSVWDAGSKVTLCKVPWNSDYRDVVKFDNQAALASYIENGTTQQIRMDEMTYLNQGVPIRISLPNNVASLFNYVRVQNPLQPIAVDGPDRLIDYYYFITSTRRIAGNTTELTLQLDVFQTYIYTTTFGNAYVERGHIGIANGNQHANNGRDFLTTPEGLDIGSDYEIADVWQHKIAQARDLDGLSETSREFSVMVVSTTRLDIDPGTVENPLMESAQGSQFENLPNGAEIYFAWNLHHFKVMMAALSATPWIAQGIISITVVPHITKYGFDTVPTMVAGVEVYRPVGGTGIDTKETKLKPNWRAGLERDPRYAHLHKLMVYPYTALEMTSNSGTPLIIKPENWNDPDATVVELAHFAPPSARIMFYPYKYNAKTNSTTAYDSNGLLHDFGEHLDMATSLSNLPTFSAVNNGYTQYMASNAHSIAFQYSQADWSQQKAMTGNQLGYDQASAGMGLSETLSKLGIDANTQSTQLANMVSGARGIQGAINSVGSAGRNPIGAATGVANAALGAVIDTGQNNAALAISSNQQRRSNAASVGNMGYVRDSNKNYADFAAKGDEAQAIAAIGAKTQDAKLIQPTTAGQVGGDAFLLAQYQWGVDIKVKRLHPAAKNAVAEFWLRYGYAINRFTKMPSTLMCMSNFTYWKLRESYIVDSMCPENFKQALRGIFEKGVTVWRDPSHMGNIDNANNTPLEGFYL